MTWRAIGHAVPLPATTNAITTVLSVDLRGRTVNDTSLEGAYAATSQNASTRFKVETVIKSSGGELQVKVDAQAAQVPDLNLFVRSDPLQILRGLRDRLETLLPVPAWVAATGHLRPSTTSPQKRSRLNPAQNEAGEAARLRDALQPAVDARIALIGFAARFSPLHQAIATAQQNVQDTETELRNLQTRLAVTRGWQLRKRRRLRTQIDATKTELTRTEILVSTKAEELATLEAKTAIERGELRAVAETVSDQEIAAANQKVTETRTAAQTLRTAADTLSFLAKKARDDVADLSVPVPLSEAEQQQLEERNAVDLKAVTAKITKLEETLTNRAERRSDLISERANILDQLGQQESKVIGDAKIIATTLARVALNAHITDRRYDYIIVDEVSAALTPFVILAAGYANTGFS